MPEPKFVIVGTGRSGSTYISQLLTRSGIPCGGESWWSPSGRHREVGPWSDEKIVGDSSCCALAQGLDGYEGIVFHQIRHPLDVILSYIRAPVQDPHLSIFRRLIPDADPADIPGFAMRFWLACAETAELYTTGGWWRLDQIDSMLIHQIGNLIGMPVADDAVEAAFANTPVTVHYEQREPRLTWESLERHDLEVAEQIRKVADRYGFE